MTRRMRYLVPFSFCNEGYCVENVCNKADARGNRWVQASVKAEEQDLYKFVLDSFADYGSRMDNTYVATSFMYQTHDGGPAKSLRYYRDYYENRGDKSVRKFHYIADFDIKELGLFLFGTGVGFLWYEISDFYRLETETSGDEVRKPYDVSVEELYDFQFQFKELNRKRYAELFRGRTDGGEDLFLMGNWIAGLLKSLNLRVNFFAERENERLSGDENVDECLKVPDKAVLFSYFAFDEKEVGEGYDVSVPAYYLTKGYKTSYIPPANVAEQMLHPFRNVSIFAAQEGAGYFVRYGESARSNFTWTMYNKIMNDYFLMYILLLHQKYAVVKLREEIGSNLSAVATDYSERIISSRKAEEVFLENENRLDEMVTKLTVFVTKNIHTSVSHIQHQNEFYSYVSAKLEIQNEIANLSQGVQVLQDNLRNKRAKYEAEKEGKRDHRISGTLALISVVAFISTLFSIEGFVHDFLLKKAEGSEKVLLLSHPAYVGVLCVFGAVFLYVVASLVVNELKQRKVRVPWKVIRDAWATGKAEANEKERLKALQYDGLTGLYNMRAYAGLESFYIKELRKRKSCLLVGMVDINGLDKINREEGRAQGDTVVCQVATVLEAFSETYPKMKVFRKEADRFLLLDVVNVDELESRKKQLEEVMMCMKASDGDGRECLCVSYGFSVLKGEDASAENCLEQAREEAYFALKKMKKEK